MFYFDPLSDKGASRRKSFKYLPHEPGDEGHDPAREIGISNWVLSYADMMTSTLVFILMLLAFSEIKTSRLEEVSRAVRGEKIVAAPAVRTPIEKVEEKLAKEKLPQGISFTKELEGATLSIPDSVLFESGRAAIPEKSRKKLRPVFETLKSLPEDYRFTVEGYTDDNPIHTFEYASNWELSAARSLSVLLFMKELGFDQQKLSFQAFGEFAPFVPNRDDKGNPIPENQTRNRRAVIKIRKGVVAPGGSV